ncbi:MAG: hypothetical protein P8Y47_09215 [Alphaproteobacteria bacterium]
MLLANSLPPLPRFSLDNLIAVMPGLPILARLALNGHGSAPRGSLEKVLAALYFVPEVFSNALEHLVGEGQVIVSRNGHCRVTDNGREHINGCLGNLLACNWTDIALPRLAALTLGIDAQAPTAQKYLARKGNLECAALARLYGISEAGEMPSRADVHAALLREFVTSRLPECESAFMEISMRTTSRDTVGRAVLLGAAGLQRGTFREAETALLRRALGIGPETSGSIADALIRNGIAKSTPCNPLPVVISLRDRERESELQIPRGRAENPELEAFATLVRDLARTLRTDPFAGRVAIAQVYDAGTAHDYDFGTLDAFKSKVAEAGRAGLLDLERYDIAGPMDDALRDRSRTTFGRDERHFIVNEWI